MANVVVARGYTPGIFKLLQLYVKIKRIPVLIEVTRWGPLYVQFYFLSVVILDARESFMTFLFKRHVTVPSTLGVPVSAVMAHQLYNTSAINVSSSALKRRIRYTREMIQLNERFAMEKRIFKPSTRTGLVSPHTRHRGI